MKKLLLVVLMLMAFGCTGINTNVAVNVASDTAFVLALQNNPSYKPVVIKALTETKALLTGSLTYDDLMVAIATKLPGKYAVVGVILSGYIQQDKPIVQTYLPMLESYKAAIVTKIDRFLLLANL
jgi:hypothetical protein